jgi:hypothetical protein
MTTTWISSLSDSGIRTDLQSFTADGTFSYADALQLLKDVAGRGTVTAAEFSDLQTIAANLETQNGISSSTYVASLFYQLAEGSAANATWNGGSPSASVLGNLAAGTTSTQLNELIDKWFLGSDLPDPTASSSGTTQTLHPSYSDFSAYQLFGTTGTPQLSDVAQGYDGDCELCSGMIEMLDNHPSQLQSMFVDDGNGVYGVRFYVNGKETWVTVDSELPTDQGSLVYNDSLASGTNAGLWADLIEKAYAQLSATGNTGHASVNSYNNISADPAFDVLTNLTNASSIDTLTFQSVNWNAYKNIIAEAVEAHDDVILETGQKASDHTVNAQGQDMLVSDHAFAVVGYDSGTGEFIVRNPWGVENGQTWVTQFEVSMNDVATVEGDFVIDNSAAPNVVFNYAEQIVALASTTTPSFGTAAEALSAGSVVALSPLITQMDTAGLAITEYKIELLGTGALNLNGATDLANAAQQAAGEVVVSASDLAKLTISTGTAGGTVDLFISGNDGTGWSTPGELYWNVETTQLAVVPAVDPIIAPSASLPVAGLFSLTGPLAGETGLTYYLSIEAGGGTIHLNGATDLLGGAGAGQIEVSAADLAKLTYTASANSGVAVLDVTVTDGTHTSDVTQVPVDVGYSVAKTLSVFDAGETPYQVAVADSAATIFANLDQLEQMMPSWALLGIAVTDSGIPTETITAAQLSADRGVLSIIDATLILDVTASGTTQSIEGVSNLATVVVFSGTASQYSLTALGSGVVDVTGSAGTTAVSGVVALQFSDHEVFVASQTPSVAGAVSSSQVADLYAAVFARTPDAAGLNYYEQEAAGNPALTIVNFATSFLSSPEYQAAHSYAQTLAGETQFITDTYNNLLHRAPEAGAASWYITNIVNPALAGQTAGTAAYAAADLLAHAEVLADFSQSGEFLSDVQVTAAHPADAQHWLVLV